MKKKFPLLLTVLLAAAVASFGQQAPYPDLNALEHLNINEIPTPPARPANLIPDKCGFAYTMTQGKANGFSDGAYEREMLRLINLRKQMNSFGPPTVIYTLPVIFHILYDGNSEAAAGTGANLSQLRIQAQINQLNKDFANLSGSVYGVSEDMGVRFVAAKEDQAGNLLCEPGIERINWRTRTGWTDPGTFTDNTTVANHFTQVVKPESIWNPYQYLNIWAADFDASGLVGAATFPGLSTLNGLNNLETDATAGVVVQSGTVGSLGLPGTATPYQSGRTLTHELGHFFGLRHITGDAVCGDDYCDDTPTQSTLSTGCPSSGSLNDCVPSAVKMFENYMDYSNDVCVNTFTLNQSERCQAVMLNSPRRLQLASSTKGISPIPNRIFFRTTLAAVSESATGSCPRFKDYTITLGVDVAATGNASVSLAKSGTATDGADYITFPAVVTYTNGDASDKTFTLRVYDDAVVEGSENIQFAVNIVGSGVQNSAACPAQFSLSLGDDDNILEINNTTSQVTLLSENFGTVTGSNQVPPGWGTSSTSVNQWVGNSADAAIYGFDGNTLHISDASFGTVSGGTASINYSTSVTTDARAATPALNAQGLKNISISVKLVGNGQASLDFGVIYYSLDGTNFTAARDASDNFIIQGISNATTVTMYLPVNTTGTNSLRFLFRWLTNSSGGSQPPFTIDDIVVSGQPTAVEAELNHSGSEFLPLSASPSYFLSTNDRQIIATVRNNTPAINCLTASIQNQGTGITSVTTSAGIFFRSQKVISLNADIANLTASYQATFYFTTAELASWGTDVANLKLMKVKTGVNLAGILTAADAQVVPAVVGDLRAAKGYASFSGDFTGGFSQFFLVSPTAAVPVTLVAFEVKATSKNILLNWTTSAEINNKGFVIERSINGTDFEKTGWVEGGVNSSTPSNYRYTDNYVQPGVMYYYRLRQIDLDERETLSSIRQAKIKGQSVIVSVSPNPANDRLNLFTGGYTGLVQIRLINTRGQVIKNWNHKYSAAPRLLDISNIPSGLYLVKVQTGSEIFTEKVIIQ